MEQTLSLLKPGERGTISRIDGEEGLKLRLVALGFRVGAQVDVLHSTLFGNPRTYLVCGCQLSLRNNEAKLIHILRQPDDDGEGHAGAEDEPAPCPQPLPRA